MSFYLLSTFSFISDRYKPASVGRALDGVEVKIHEPDPDSGDGEICFRGRNVFMGYLDNETKTREAIDDEGWLHSGDIGRVDEDGKYMYSMCAFPFILSFFNYDLVY